MDAGPKLYTVELKKDERIEEFGRCYNHEAVENWFGSNGGVPNDDGRWGWIQYTLFSLDVFFCGYRVGEARSLQFRDRAVSLFVPVQPKCISGNGIHRGIDSESCGTTQGGASSHGEYRPPDDPLFFSS